MDYTHVIVFSGVGSALSAFLMWGFAKSLGMIFAFVVIFGGIVSPVQTFAFEVEADKDSHQSSGFSSTAPAASKDIAGELNGWL